MSLMVINPYAFAAAGGAPTDTGWVIAGAGASVNTGSGPSWTNPGNITADDGTNATCGTTSAAQTDHLKASNFGFAIPTDATINGFEIRVQANSSFGTLTYNVANIGKDDSTLGTAKNPGETVTTTPTDYDQGSASDLWDLSWTPAEVNSSDFQARFAFAVDGFQTVQVDAVWVKVYYTP